VTIPLRRISRFLTLPLIALALASCGSSDAENDVAKRAATSNPQSKQSTATAASGLAATPVYDLNGRPRDLSQWIGKRPVVVNFWGTWCGPCRREIPGLVKLYLEYQPQGVEIISLAVKDYPQQVRAFAERAGMSWVHMMATNESVKAFRLTGSVPTTIFLDASGNEVARFIGAQDYDTFKGAFAAIAPAS